MCLRIGQSGCLPSLRLDPDAHSPRAQRRGNGGQEHKRRIGDEPWALVDHAKDVRADDQTEDGSGRDGVGSDQRRRLYGWCEADGYFDGET